MVVVVLVAKGLRQVHAWIEGTFIVNELVLLDERSREERVGFGLALNGVGLRDGQGAWSGERSLQFVEEVGAHDLVVELGGPFTVEGEPLNFAADFAATGLVPVRFGTGTAEIHDVIPRFQFVGEFSQMIPQG